MNNQYPAIHLNYVQESLSSYIAQIEYGIEEEGLFSICTLVPTSSLQESTYASAQASKVGIALGISQKQIFLMHRKAGPDTFILHKAPPSLTDAEGRTLGKNAARLVKGLPLYPV
ncbi:MAG: hypothetical protein HFE76_07450 [Firmicutes bacterium]|nr:hypothetical protein [Bacillota bacterium]